MKVSSKSVCSSVISRRGNVRVARWSLGLILRRSYSVGYKREDFFKGEGKCPSVRKLDDDFILAQ